MAEKEKDKPYNLDPDFEAATVLLSCRTPKFFGRLGHAVDPDCLGSAEGKLALTAAQACAADLGKGPDSTVLVIQRLRRWRSDGRVTHEEILAVSEYFDAAEDKDLPSEESVVAEFTPILRRRLQHEVVTSSMSEYAKRGDFERIEELLADSKRLGEVDTSMGVKLGAEAFQVIEGMRHLERLPTGITELDFILDDGLWRGALGMVVGGAGDGKSTFLTHIGGTALENNLFVVEATLELPEAIVAARVMAFLTGVPVNQILSGDIQEAQDYLAMIEDDIGMFVVKSFPPKATTVDDLKAWVGTCENNAGRKVDLLIVDYADKMIPSVSDNKNKSASDGGYRAMEYVYEALRTWMEDSHKWGWTASQKKGLAKGKKIADVDDASDSRNKGRVVDMAITLNKQGEFLDQILYYVAKHRLGVPNVQAGPFPTDFAVGRMIPKP